MGTRGKRGGGTMVLAGLPRKKMQPDSAAMSKEGLTVLSWNLEGLAEDELDARTRVAMTEVLGLSPTIACFQEVVPRSLATVQRCLHAVYEDAERESPPSGSSQSCTSDAEAGSRSPTSCGFPFALAPPWDAIWCA